MQNKLELDVRGMHCASCVLKVEKAIKKVPNVLNANVNLATEKATVSYQGDLDLKKRFFISAILSVLILIGTYQDFLGINVPRETMFIILLLLTIPVQFYIGSVFHKIALRNLKHFNFDMN